MPDTEFDETIKYAPLIPTGMASDNTRTDPDPNRKAFTTGGRDGSRMARDAEREDDTQAREREESTGVVDLQQDSTDLFIQQERQLREDSG